LRSRLESEPKTRSRQAESKARADTEWENKQAKLNKKILMLPSLGVQLYQQS
jgi:hypothetical protein